MDDDRQVRPGFLPPRAPGGAEPPRFEAPAPRPASPPAPEPARPAPYTPPDRPVFVARQSELGPSSALAIAGTALGSVALLLLVLSLGLGYPLCGLLSLVGLVMGLNARRRIKATGQGRPGQAKAAMWVGAIGIGLAIVAALVWAGLDASGFSPDDLRQWLEDQLEQQRSSPGGGTPSESVPS